MNVTGVSTTHAARFDCGQFSAEPLAVVHFSSIEVAEFNVAGLPAAARALREVALTGAPHCAIAVPGNWVPSAAIIAELDRLAGAMPYACVDSSMPDVFGDDEIQLVVGEQRVAAAPPGETMADRIARSEATFAAFAGTMARTQIATHRVPEELRRASAAIVAATTKPGDGIVSRHINRPISRAISTMLLRFPAIRPIHATVGTALIAIAMAVSLLLGGQAGLIAGAVLFQAASMFDGVDGEIARATFRTSARGAMLDSLIDAATNLGFIAGVALNLYLQGDSTAAIAGGIAMALLAVGLTLIGRAAKASKRPFTFNGVKERVGAGKSRVMTWLTMRDFFALAAAVLIIVGLAPLAMFAFAVVTVGWLMVVLVVLHRQPA